MSAAAAPRLGLVVNPVAGLGGPVGAKGSDAPGIVAAALAAGAAPQATARAARAIAAFRTSSSAPILTGPGALGADAAPDAQVIDIAPEGSAADTAALVRAMQGRVDLILFCGGDGTARDVAAANAGGIPILGVPAGVKMHSGVFCRTPERAGLAAADFLEAEAPRLDLVEILDIDEAARRSGRLSAKLYTVARTPAATGARQGPKAGGGDLLAEVDAALAEYVRHMAPGCAYVIGPGTTMAALKDRLGGGTLLGVDVARDGAIVARDAGERAILAEIGAGPARIVLTVIGGQGFLLGRGNQQISPEVIRRVGPDRIDVICAAGKLARLEELSVDTGDSELDCTLSGYRQIRTGPGRRQVVRVAC
jgi:predicted polyphosphate/ATP-dependent NAD kinase